MNDLSRFCALLWSCVLALGLPLGTGRADAAKTSNDELKALRAEAASPDGFQPLFKEDLSDATFRENSWTFKDGVLSPNMEVQGTEKEKSKPKSDIWTKERYGDFILDLEFKCEPKTNSGVFLRCKDIKQWLHTSIEVQILQQDSKTTPTRQSCGAVYDCLAPTKQMVRPAGEWNHTTIIAKANKICVVLNGEPVIDMDLDRWTEAHKNPDGTKNKFNTAYKDMARAGFIGLQFHGQPVQFRNLKVKPLGGEK